MLSVCCRHRLIKFQNEENAPYGEAILAARLRPAI